MSALMERLGRARGGHRFPVDTPARAIAVAGALLGLSIVVLAPGNAVRRAQFPPSVSFQAEIRKSFDFGVAYVVGFAQRAGEQTLLVMVAAALLSGSRDRSADVNQTVARFYGVRSVTIPR